MSAQRAAAQCWQAIAAVLTGERPEPPARPDWRADSVADWLVSLGWDRQALGERRRHCQQERLVWPDRLPDDLASGLEFARYSALLAEVRRLLGVDGLPSTIHHGPRIIGPAEERLLREVPPHSVQR